MRIRSFLCDDSGAVTVDWVVLCAGIVGMSLVLMGHLRDRLSTDLTRILTEADARVTQ